MGQELGDHGNWRLHPKTSCLPIRDRRCLRYAGLPRLLFDYCDSVLWFIWWQWRQQPGSTGAIFCCEVLLRTSSIQRTSSNLGSTSPKLRTSPELRTSPAQRPAMESPQLGPRWQQGRSTSQQSRRQKGRAFAINSGYLFRSSVG